MIVIIGSRAICLTADLWINWPCSSCPQAVEAGHRVCRPIRNTLSSIKANYFLNITYFYPTSNQKYVPPCNSKLSFWFNTPEIRSWCIESVILFELIRKFCQHFAPFKIFSVSSWFPKLTHPPLLFVNFKQKLPSVSKGYCPLAKDRANHNPIHTLCSFQRNLQ